MKLVHRVLCMLLATGMVITLAACGSTEGDQNDTEALNGTLRNDIVSIHDCDDYVQLEGTWISAAYKEGESRFKTTVSDGSIIIYYMHDHSADVCWIGSCPEYAENEFESQRNDYYLMDFDYETMTFTIKDSLLCFTYQDERGKDVKVSMEHMGDSIDLVVNLAVKPPDDVEWYDSDDGSSEDTQTTVKPSQDTTTTQTDKTPVISANNDTTVNQPATTACSHTYGAGVVTKAASCTTTGIRSYTCTKCGNVQTEVIPATGHNYVSTVTKEATCGSNGTQVYTCSVCGDSYESTIPATGEHQWTDVTETVKTEEEGHYEKVESTVTTYQCDECGYSSSSMNDVQAHVQSAHDGTAGVSMVETPQETETWVIDTPAGEKEVITGQVCEICGATK